MAGHELHPGHPLAAAIGFGKRSRRGIALLETIGEEGSINRSAARLGVSYKAAWDLLEALNNLASAPLLQRTVGGRGGGGTRLTEAGADLVRDYREAEREYRRFLAFLDQGAGKAAVLSGLLRRMEMKVSARNVWSGQVRRIRDGAVNAEVEIALCGGDALVAVVTRESARSLGLREGEEVLALANAASVHLARDVAPGQVSSRNVLADTVARVVEGAVNSEVTLELPGGNTVTATVTRESVARLGLQVGLEASALIKASSVWLAVV